ncbi:MAG TPA: hypothetical protein VF538_16835 [Pyrinomonadaceae bacterium]
MLLITFCILIVLAMGCSGNMGDLTRDNARKLIEDSERFKAPLVVILKDQKELPLRPESPDETEQEARARVIDMHLSSNPALAVLRRLGYTEVRATLVRHARVPDRALPEPWVFNLELTLTDKGREAAKSQGLTDDKTVPLARREVVEVTGVRKEGIRGEAEFTWKAVPTEAGQAFDLTSDTFKSLPPELREALTKARGIGPFASSATIDWADVHKTSAVFQKYDDGWRLTGVRL